MTIAHTTRTTSAAVLMMGDLVRAISRVVLIGAMPSTTTISIVVGEGEAEEVAEVVVVAVAVAAVVAVTAADHRASPRKCAVKKSPARQS